MFRYILNLFLIMFLVSCATTKKYEEKLNTWMYSDADELVRSWGSPSSTYEMQNGEKILMYDFSRTGAIPMTNYQSGNTSYIPFNRHCKTEFTVSSENKIISWSFEGNDCVSD